MLIYALLRRSPVNWSIILFLDYKHNIHREEINSTSNVRKEK
jgi:hypothetical protein